MLGTMEEHTKLSFSKIFAEQVLRTLKMYIPFALLGVTSLQRNARVVSDEATFYVRPSMLAIFSILQTMLVIAFTADCLLQRRNFRSRREPAATTFVQCIYMIDVIILSAITTEIVLSLTNAAPDLRYSCAKTVFPLVTKLTTIVWISIGIAFARLTLVEVLCNKERDESTVIVTHRLRTYTKCLINYTLLSVALYALPLVAQLLPEVVICVPVPQTDHENAVMFLIMLIIFVYIVFNGRNQSPKLPANVAVGSDDRTERKVMCVRTAQYVAIVFLTLFPFILVNTRASKPAFNVYKMFGFYTTLSLGNITINRIYHLWNERQMQKYHYYIV